MKPKMMLKMGIDLVMTVLLLCQMAYILVGETVHEYLGTAMFVLFILHHLLLRSQFVFFDMEQPLALFFAEYLAMMGLWACLAYYLSRALQRLSVGKEGKGKA